MNARLTRVRKKIHNFCFLLNHVMEDFQCSCEMLLIIAAHIYVGLTSSTSVLNSGYRSCYNFRRQTVKPPKNTCFNIRLTPSCNQLTEMPHIMAWAEDSFWHLDCTGDWEVVRRRVDCYTSFMRMNVEFKSRPTIFFHDSSMTSLGSYMHYLAEFGQK